MENYINIDGKKIKLSKETVAKLKCELGIKDKLTYEDVAKELFLNKKGFFISSNGTIPSAHALEINDANNSTTKEQLESILALNKLANVAKYLNGDWLPDWTLSEWKYYICYSETNNLFSIGYLMEECFSDVYFKSEELAEQAIEILGEEEIRKALTLNH